MMNSIVGNRFGRLTVIEPGKKVGRKQYYICKCDCGNTCEVRIDHLKSGATISCGCMAKDKRNIIGKRYGRLTVLEEAGSYHLPDGKTNGKYYKCQCDCGNVVNVLRSNLVNGKQISCGCKAEENYKSTTSKQFGIIDGTNINTIQKNNPTKANTSGTRGVTWHAGRKKWIARIMFKGQSYWLGAYEKKEDAIKARKEAEKQVYGPFIEWYNKEYMGECLDLTPRQKEVYALYKHGASPSDIAKELGCSKQNVSNILKTIQKGNKPKKKKPQVQSPRKQRPQNTAVDYGKYRNSDMATLSGNQRKALLLKIDGQSTREIAEALDVSVTAVYNLLQVARMKCDGKWKEHTEKLSEYNKDYNSKNRERKTQAAREYREKNREHLKKYNREYYKNHKGKKTTSQ